MIIDQTAKTASQYQALSSSPEPYAENLVRQPSVKVLVSSAFISCLFRYVAFNTASPIRPAWVVQLGELPKHKRSPVLDLALLAVATAFYGVTSNNLPAIKEACGIYGEALARHSKVISKHTETPSTATICTSVVLSLFEAIWSTNSDAYVIHLLAARSMLGSLGDKLADNALLMQVAVHVQYQTVYIS
jgi:hypothetical protein